jgi:hypothetical protein
VDNSTRIDFRGDPPLITVTSPANGTVQKVDFKVNATITDTDGDLDEAWVEVWNSTGQFVSKQFIALASPNHYSTAIDIDALKYGDGYRFHVKANDTFGNVVTSVLVLDLRPKEITTLLATGITYQVDGTTANAVIYATANITHNSVVRSKEIVVYIPSTWIDAASGEIRRGLTSYTDLDLPDPTKFEFYIPDYAASDILVFAINAPRFTFVAEEEVNSSYSYMEYTMTARRSYTGVKTPSQDFRLMEGEWAYHVEVLVGTEWVRVDAATYNFVVIGDYFKTFTMTVPSINPSETVRIRVVAELVPGTAVNTTKITMALIIAPSVAGGMAVVAYLSPLKKRLPGWAKLALAAGPAIVVFVLFMI